jgi:hypothetical protein
MSSPLVVWNYEYFTAGVQNVLEARVQIGTGFVDDEHGYLLEPTETRKVKQFGLP